MPAAFPPPTFLPLHARAPMKLNHEHPENETLTDDTGVVAELGPELAGAVHDAVDTDPEPRARARLVSHARAVEPAREDTCAHETKPYKLTLCKMSGGKMLQSRAG